MISAWIPLAVATDNSHLLANFGQPSSSALVYNLFADKLLQLKAVPDSVSVVFLSALRDSCGADVYAYMIGV